MIKELSLLLEVMASLLSNCVLDRRLVIQTKGNIMTVLAELGFDSDNPHGIVEVRGVLFCPSKDAYSTAILTAEASPNFTGAHVIRHLGEFIGQSSHLDFWGGTGLEVTIVDCRRWSKLHFGYDLSLILGYMTGGLASAAVWSGATDQMTAFVTTLTHVTRSDWQEFVSIVLATKLDKRSNLFFRFGKGGLDQI